jgi:membrane protease YdiL (CAAX protease family)
MSISLLQTAPATQPGGVAATAISFLLLFAGIPLSLFLVRRYRLLHGLARMRPFAAGGGGLMLLAGFIIAYAVQHIVLLLLLRAQGVTEYNLADPGFMRLVLQMQPLVLGAALVVTPIFVALLHPDGIAALQLRFTSAWQHLRDALSAYLLVLPWVIVANAVTTVISAWLEGESSVMHDVFKNWEQSGGIGGKLVLVATAVVFAPLLEELVFRGLLQNFLLGIVRFPIVAVVLTSLAFAAVHHPWQMRPPIFVLSLCLGWTYIRTGSLVTAMLLHALFNGIQFALFLTLVS